MNRPRIQKKGKTQMNTRNPGEPVEGAIAEPDFVNETPEDIENFLADHGIKDVTYIYFASHGAKPMRTASALPV